MKYTEKYLMLVFLLLCLPCFAQNLQKPLKIGDTVPDLVLKNLINYKNASAKLSDFKDKVIILDFWNKFCSTCIAAMPEMQILQEEFKSDLAILLVNSNPSDTREKLNYLFEKSSILKSSTLPMVLGDSNFSSKGKLFPHRGDPYHVWIDKNRVIKAITGLGYANSDNVKTLIAGRTPNVIMRDDVSFLEKTSEIDHIAEHKKSILDAYNGLLRKYIVYYNKIKPNEGFSDRVAVNAAGNIIIDPQYPYHTALIKNPLSDLANLANYGGGGYLRDSIGNSIGRRDVGSPLDLFAGLYNYPVKVIVEAENGHQYYKPRDASGSELEKWMRDNSFIYESVLPGWNNERYKEALERDLETYFGLTGAIEIKQIKCIVFHRTEQALKLPKSKGGEMLVENVGPSKGVIVQNHFPMMVLVQKIISMNQDILSPVVLDETGISQLRTDMVIHSNFNDIPVLNRELRQYGIGVKEETRQLPVLVLRGINKK